MKTNFYRLEPLTPVHIGTGETLDPFSYVIKDDLLHYVDLTGWVESHPDPEGLARKLSGEVHAVRAHIAETLDLGRFSLSTAKVVSREIAKEYRDKLKDPRNQLKIAPALKNSSTQALNIPGSSIKGAIRTAVIDLLDREHGLALKQATADDKLRGKRNQNYEDRLKAALGDISSNAFKNLKVTDFEAPVGAAVFVTAREMGRKADKPPTPKDPCEALPGICQGGGAVSLVGKLNLGAASALDPRGETLNIDFHGNKMPLTIEQLAHLCTDFYRQRYTQERQKFYGLPHFAKTARALAAIEQQVSNVPVGGFLLRIGHYSHVESMTITDNDPETRMQKGKMMPYGTTRTLADGIYPFGWVRLVPCTEAEYVTGLFEREKSVAVRSVKSAAAPLVIPKPVPQIEVITWEAAQLVWNPGNATLTATQGGQKAEAKFGVDRSLVPEALQNKLFNKKQAVLAKVTLEKEGNLFRIVNIG